jgi:hypothetical protein
LLTRIDDLAERLPDAFREAGSGDDITAVRSALPERLATRVADHAKRCRIALAKT